MGLERTANGVTTPLSRHGKVSSPPRRKLIPNPSSTASLSLSLSPSRFVNFDQQLRVSSSFIPGDCTFVPSCAPQPHLLLLLLLLFPFPPPNSRSFLHEAILFDGRTHDGKSGTSSLVPANAKACVSRRVEFTRAASRIFTSRAASPLPSFRSAPLFPRPPPRLRYFFFLSISLQKMRRSISPYSIRIEGIYGFRDG